MSDNILSNIDNGVMTVTLNRPEALNAFLPEMLVELTDIVKGAKAKGAKVIVLEGAGRAFTAGMDLKVLNGVVPKDGQLDPQFDEPGINCGRALRGSDVPIIAKVHGACFTGGLEVALSCDMIYTTIDTKFGDTHAKFGLRPSWGMSQTLPRAVGAQRAKDLSYTGRTFLGADAVQYGIALEAAEDKVALDALVAERAAAIAVNSQGAIDAYADLYAYAADNAPLEEATREELARAYEISDTAERLGTFLNR